MRFIFGKIAGVVRQVLAKGPRTGDVDHVLAAAVIALMGFGLTMVYSSSVIEATVAYNDGEYFLRKQAIFVLLGLVVLWVGASFDYRKLKPLTYPMFLTVVALLLACIAGLGHSGGGAARWIRVGPFNVQPSEIAKLALILWLGYSLEKKKELIRTFSVGLLPHLVMAGSVMLLCLLQPDFGGSVVLFFLTFALLFVAGADVRYLVGFTGVLSLCGYVLVRFSTYRWARVQAFLHIFEHRRDLAYQPFQSVMSFGSGEWTGLGLGKGLQVLYLPESWTDFIAAIIGEEFGFLGILVLCAVYALIVARGVRAAFRAEDDHGSYIAFGISMFIGVQAIVNLSMAMAMLPTKGLTLPFVSYGGSSLLVNAAAVGILLNISRPRRSAANVKLRPDAPAPDVPDPAPRKRQRQRSPKLQEVPS